MYNREERFGIPSRFGGTPPPYFPTKLCWAATVMTINGNGVISNIFGAINSLSITSAVGFQNGWIDVEMLTSIPIADPAVHTLVNMGLTSVSGRSQLTTTGNTVTYVGLPLIGFAAISYTNGTLVVGSQNVLSNYGGTFVHKTSTLVQ
jgi:hypothetical protein